MWIENGDRMTRASGTRSGSDGRVLALRIDDEGRARPEEEIGDDRRATFPRSGACDDDGMTIVPVTDSLPLTIPAEPEMTGLPA